MSRISRNHLKSNFFHVIVQGINKEYIFEEETQKKVYLKCLFEKSENYDINIISFCIMDNHAHILLHTNNIEDMSRFMKQINEKYALFYNREKNRVGYVFRNRYKSEPIYEERYLYQCIAYIHRNPVKAGITKLMDEYQFASTMQYSLNKVKELYDYNLLIYSDKENSDEYNFIDIKEQIDETEIEKIIDHIILSNMKKFQIREITKQDRGIIESIIIEIREKTGASMEIISKKLKISKSSVSGYLKGHK